MALKKKTAKPKREQLYMLEVLVDQLTLKPEIPDVKIEDLLVCARFTDLPEYEINIPKNGEANETSSDSKSRKSCLFAKTPSCLIRAIRWSPLTLELYRKDSACPEKSRLFLGTTRITLPTCMCNHVASTQNKTDGLSTACVVKDSFDLTGPNGKVSGRITVILRLSCFGSSIIEQFSLSGKSFMLEDSPLQKFLCTYISPEKSKDEERSRNEEGTDKPLLKRPDSPPRISMDDPAFKTLTSAEKLNDPRYRELIYTAYPDEPTCCCLPTDRAKHPMECRSGCNRPCCMKLRNPDLLSTREDRRVEDTLANTYCVNNLLPALHALKQDSPCGKQSRLRGGGDIEQIYTTTGYRWASHDTDYIWDDEKANRDIRMEGGGEEKGMASCSCSGGPVMVPPRKASSQDKDVVAIFDACTPRVTSTGAKPTCVCPGKDAKLPRGAAKCMKQPCMGIDCLIRAFKDAQDFVDSIGKVPGLPGLGLMDPSESPYFGRDLDRDYVVQEQPSEKRKTPAGSAHAGPGTSAPTCTAPCSVQGKFVDDARSHVSPYTSSIPRGINVPPRLGIVREAIPVLPEVGSTTVSTKHRKKDEKKDEKTDKQLDPASSVLMEAEVGPCGEPKCKSRRKKPADNGSMDQSSTHISSRMRASAKHAANRKARGKGKKASKGPLKRRAPKSRAQRDHRGHQQTKATDPPADYRERALGPGGDRVTSLQSPIPVSKRVMRYVYFVGDYYPGTTFGHRNCIELRMRVPANMGWLWTSMETAGKLKPRIGWRPGAIGRYLYEMLQDAKENSLAIEEEYETLERADGKSGKVDRARFERGRGDRGRLERGRLDRGRGDRGRITERARSVPSRQRSGTRRQRSGRPMSYQGMQKQSKMEGEEDGPEPPPTLHIHRKDGTYYVTMYPIRQETSGEEPRLSEPMKPLQFKIVKNKDEASDASSSTASDMEIEFSPPAAVARYRKKPDVIHVDTQVRQQEIIDAYKAEELKKKGRRGRRAREEERRREKKKNSSGTSIKK
ncbi:uncharacterized protein LOC143430129 [Xylocopa sonorina]|uniref:uncharacterized protein LOC143430129 n=1 Tax=Xylocopa sonorina TaxID=1818115 RepID=UPI00403AEA37